MAEEAADRVLMVRLEVKADRLVLGEETVVAVAESEKAGADALEASLGDFFGVWEVGDDFPEADAEAHVRLTLPDYVVTSAYHQLWTVDTAHFGAVPEAERV